MGDGGVGSGDFPTREKSTNVDVKSTSMGGKIFECFVIASMETIGVTLSVHVSYWFMKKAAMATPSKSGNWNSGDKGDNVISLRWLLVHENAHKWRCH